tara:strand:+ start:3460 stop:4014 length:555 start_codon:yes stop_codon:yes gene_type:complete
MNDFFRVFLLIILVPVAFFKIGHFFKRFSQVIFQEKLAEDQRKSLERIWLKPSNNDYSKFVILLFLLIFTIYIKPVQALTSDDYSKSTLAFENKISKNFSSKFCNSIAFGLSEESSMKFTIGEIEKEIKKPLLARIDKELLLYKISDEIVYNCGMSIGLKGENGVQKINLALKQMNLFSTETFK